MCQVNTESGRVANTSGSNVKLSNISIHNGSTIGINVASNNTMVMGCSVYNNGSHGLYVHDCVNSIIQGCTIKENASYGITSTVNSVSTIIKNCIFLNNGGTDVLIGGEQCTDMRSKKTMLVEIPSVIKKLRDITFGFKVYLKIML